MLNRLIYWPCSRVAGANLRNKPLPDGVQHQLSEAMQVELLLQISAMSVNRMGAEIQLLAISLLDLLPASNCRISRSREVNRSWLSSASRARISRIIVVRQHSADFRTEKSLASIDGSNRLHEIAFG